MAEFTAIVTAVLGLFRHKFTLYGFTISYWDVLIWSLVAGIVISFIKGLLTVTNKFATVLCACLMSVTALAHGIHAEDYEDVPDEAPPAAVEEAASEETPAACCRKMLRVYLWRSTLLHWPKL